MSLTKRTGTVAPRVGTNTNTHTATKAMTLVPMDVSQMSSNVSKQGSDPYQCERDRESDGDEVFPVKGKDTGGFLRDLFQ